MAQGIQEPEHVWLVMMKAMRALTRYAAAGVVTSLLKAGFEVDRDELFDLLLYLSVRPAYARDQIEATIGKLIEQAESEAARSPLSDSMR